MTQFFAAWRAHMCAPITLAAWAIFSTLMAIAGPFGTFHSMAGPARLVLWAGMIGGALMVVYAVCEVLKIWTGEARTIGRDTKVAILFAALYAPVVWGLVQWHGIDGSALDMPLWLTTFYVFTITLAVMMLRRILGVGDEPLAGPAPPILQRLDGVRPEQIARLSVEDHYVHVHLECGGSKRLLMRFSDALSELDGLDGVRTHRSHWVARPAVTGVERQKGRTFLVTRDAARVPVSRGFLDDVASSGLL